MEKFNEADITILQLGPPTATTLPVPISAGASKGRNLVEALAEAGRERLGFGNRVRVVVDCDATGSVVGQHRDHGWDVGSGTHRVDTRHPRTRQIQRTADRP